MSVNAPEACTITEILVQEGDTVTVGQEVARAEPSSGGGKSEASEKKDTDSDTKKVQAPLEPKSEDKTKSPSQPAETKPESKPESKTAPSSSKPSPPKQQAQQQQQTSKPAEPSTSFAGGREERRVRFLSCSRESLPCLSHH